MLDCSFGGVPLPTGKEGTARGDACAAGVTPAPAGIHPRGQEVLVTHGPGVEGGTWGIPGGCRHGRVLLGISYRVWEMRSCILTLCKCPVSSFIRCIANTDPEHSIHWLPVNYVSLISQYTALTMIRIKPCEVRCFFSLQQQTLQRCFAEAAARAEIQLRGQWVTSRMPLALLVCVQKPEHALSPRTRAVQSLQECIFSKNAKLPFSPTICFWILLDQYPSAWGSERRACFLFPFGELIASLQACLQFVIHIQKSIWYLVWLGEDFRSWS